MRYDERLASRVRRMLSARDDVVEKKMFGGLCFMVNGAMCCGLTKTDFMVRVGPAQYDDALAQPHARPMDFTGRPLAGMVYVAPEGLRSAAALAKWVGRGVRFVSSLPAKTVGTRRKRGDKNVKGAANTPRNYSTASVRSTDDESRVAALMQEFRSDPKLVAVIDAFEANTKAEGNTKFGLHGLMVNGKLFARFTQGTLVVKLPEERVAALVAARVGTQCDPGRGRLRKWLKITSTKVSWTDLAKEAHVFVMGSKR
jgi:TfoX/Sxy family transcriptional regulator of competence genes